MNLSSALPAELSIKSIQRKRLILLAVALAYRDDEKYATISSLNLAYQKIGVLCDY
jgi:hypothetical protein